MRETVAKRRPMIDLEQFERRLRQPNGADRTGEDPLAELARLVGGQDDPYKAVFDSKVQHSAAPEAETHGQYAAEDYEAAPWQEENEDDLGAQERLISGDYASIEAGLLATGRRSPTHNEDASAFAAEDEFEDWRDDQQYGPGRELDKRSRRPLYVMALVIVAGIGGIGASFALKGGSSPHEVATIKPADGPVKVQPETTAGSDAPNQDASILDRTPQAAPVAVADATEQPVDLSRMPDHAQRTIAVTGADALAPAGAASVPVPPPPARTQTPAPQQPQSIASLIEPKKVKTISVRPDGSVIANDRPPQAIAAAVVASPPAPHQPAAPTAKAATPKSTARVATTPKPAAIASGAEAAPPPKAAAVQVADAQAGAAPVSASPASGGAFAVQLAAPTSEQEARDIQARLIKKYSGEIPGFHPAIRKAVNGDKTVYRVRSLGLSKEDATALCQKVQSSGGNCFVAKN